MGRFVTALLMGLLSLAPLMVSTTAWAQTDAKQVEQLSKSAAKEYRGGNYKAAIKLFEEAYAIQAVPNLLFNIARCYEKMEDWDNAIANYDKFILDAESKEAKQKALDKVKAIKEKQGTRSAQAQNDKDNKKKEEDNKKVEPPPPADPDRTWAYVAIGTGGGLLLGGAVFGLLAQGKQTAFDDATDPVAKQDAKDSGETFALVADVMYIAGAVSVITGIILWATASPEEPPQQAGWHTGGWVGPDGAGVSLGTRF